VARVRVVRMLGFVGVTLGAVALVGGLLLLSMAGRWADDRRTSADLELGKAFDVDLDAGRGYTLYWVGVSHGGFPFFDQSTIRVIGPSGPVDVGQPAVAAQRLDWPSAGDFSFPVARFEAPSSGRYTVTFDTDRRPIPKGHPLLDEDTSRPLVTFGLLGIGALLAVAGSIAVAETTGPRPD